MNDLLFIDNLHLLTNRFFVDGFEDHFHKLCTHAALFALSTAFFKNLVITSGLKHCDIVFLFVSTDFACYAHTFCQFLNDKPISILSVPGAKECCIEFNSMSKSHNMPGWRIGMLASNAEFVQWILKVKSNIDSGMFRAMQLAAAKALEADSTWYEGNNVNYRNRRHLAGEIMKTLGCTYDEKQVGMFLWGKIPASCADVEELTEKVLQEARVFIISESDHLGKVFFKDLYNSLNLNIFEYTFDEHDETVAYSLSIPFVSTFVFAAVMKHQEAPGTTFKKHMAIAKGLLSEDDYLLQEILFNPRTPSQVENIRTELKQLLEIITNKDAEGMKKYLTKIREKIK